MKRFFLALALVLAVIITSANIAQELPFPDAPKTLTNEWAVYLTPDADPNLAAAQLGMVNLGQVGNLEGIYRFAALENIRTARPDITTALVNTPQIIQAVQQVTLVRETRGVEDTITDPLFLSQWHLNNTGATGTAGADANVYAAWNAGYTGTGVIVASVDDGVWHTNPDLTPNYRADLSWDYVGNDSDPSGGGHGTSVAGVMAADNDGAKCGVGAAFNAQVAGVRLLTNSVTDAMEASGVSHRSDAIHVYNNSWGPSDNGIVLEAPGPLTYAALEDNIVNGRGGLGAITVWAAGNGKASNDNVNADGYANLRSVIAVSATTNTGVSSWYSEPGSPILVNAPSNGGSAGIVTTGYSATSCNSSFGGTSSAAPLAAGVVALMLDANPTLTWRDVQYILLETAEKNDPTNSDWTTNAAGHDINHYYGFGRVDAGAAVALAASWTNVAPEVNAISPVKTVNQTIQDGTPGAWLTSTITIEDPIQVEHAEVVLNISHAFRGQLEIELVSPQGTTSRLMFGRTSDSGDNFTNWPMSTVRHWGEDAVGTWTLRVRDISSGTSGTLVNWQLKVYGIQLAPRIVSANIPTDVLVGDSATLSVTVSSAAPVTYQWYQGESGDTSTPVGTDSPTLTTADLLTATSFWVAITDGTNPIQSPTYTIAVVGSFSIIGTTGWDSGSLLPFRTLTPSNDKLLCSGLANTAPCAFQFVGSATEKGKLAYDINMGGRSFTLRTSNEWRISGMYNAKNGASVEVIFKYTFVDGWPEQYRQTLSGGSGWQAFEMIVPIPDTDVSTMQLRIRNKTKTNAKFWLDDLDVRYAVGSGGPVPAFRANDANPLELPAAPDGFRGNN